MRATPTDFKAQHTNLSIDCILLSSHTETTPSVCAQKASTLVHYLAVDHKLQSVILYVGTPVTALTVVRVEGRWVFQTY